MNRLNRKIRSLLFSPYTFHVETLNERFPFHIGTYEGSLWYGKDRYRFKDDIDDITPELEWTRSHLTTGDIIADIGAHHGYFALLFSRWVGKEGKVYAFECAPTNHSIFQKNIQLNGVENIALQQCAVGEKMGEVSIANDSSGIYLSSKNGKELSVPMITVDHFFGKEKIRPTMIKIDVEGYECEVLEGAKSILLNKPKVILEVHNFAHDDFKPRLERIFEMFSSYTQTFWQPGPGQKIYEFPLTKENLERAFQHPNPHLYLLP